MAGELWFCSDQIRQGFVSNFKNGYKVVVEYLKGEQEPEEESIVEKKDLIRHISWDGIAQVLEAAPLSEGDDVGVSFDVMVYNKRNRMVSLPSWNKNIKFKSGIDLDAVIDILYFVRRLK